MSDLPAVVARETIGSGRTYDGRNFIVVALYHDREWPGHGSRLTYSVEIQPDASGNIRAVSHGFYSREEAFRFCTMFRMRKTQYTLDGREAAILVNGLGLPDGLVRVHSYELGG